MATEPCAICATTVSFDATVHVLVNAMDGDGATDHYVCRSCYDAHLAGLFDGNEQVAE